MPILHQRIPQAAPLLSNPKPAVRETQFKGGVSSNTSRCTVFSWMVGVPTSPNFLLWSATFFFAVLPCDLFV